MQVVDKIVERLSACKGILEIGPGPGVLTAPLSEATHRFIALELDPRMARVLKESAPKAEVLVQDALKADLKPILEQLPEPRGVVSNLPYYITGPLLTRISEARSSFSIAVLMMQKEVAERVMAPAGNSDRGSLSVYLQAQFQIAKVCQAPAGSFLPPPKVDSTVLELVPKPDQYPAEFFRLIRMGFAQPRKTLVNNLVAGYHVERATAQSLVEAINQKPTARPAELNLQDWVQLEKTITGS